MLILATVTIGAINGGLFDYAGKAKKEVDITGEKETVEQAVIIAKGTNKHGGITKDDLDKALNKISKEQLTTMEIEEGITVTFESGRSYLVDSSGSVDTYVARVPEATPEDSTREILSTMAYGVIEIEFLSNKTYDVSTTPNPPKLGKGMKSDFLRLNKVPSDYPDVIQDGFSLYGRKKDATLLQHLLSLAIK